MAELSKGIKARGRSLARNVARFRSAVDDEDLRTRVETLEAEVQECRALNLRLAELTDVVQEMLLPVAERDEKRVAEVMEKYAKGL